jgi:DNA-binding FrmR family transcriptional regulator
MFIISNMSKRKRTCDHEDSTSSHKKQKLCDFEEKTVLDNDFDEQIKSVSSLEDKIKVYEKAKKDINFNIPFSMDLLIGNGFYRFRSVLKIWPKVDFYKHVMEYNMDQKERIIVLKAGNKFVTPWNEDTMTHAASNGHLEIVQYLWQQEVPCTPDAITQASGHGHFDVVKYLMENNVPVESKAMVYASSNGHANIVEYLVENGQYCHALIVHFAASEGHLDVVQYLIKHHKARCGDDGLTAAAANGHIEVVKYLLQQQIPFDSEVIACAAENGHIDVVNCLVDAMTCKHG